MKIKLSSQDATDLLETPGAVKDQYREVVEDMARVGWREVEIDVFLHLTQDGVEEVMSYLDDKTAAKLERHLRAFNDPQGVVIGNLENVPTIMRSILGSRDLKWVSDQDGLPWFVECVVYHKTTKDEPAHVLIHLAKRGAVTSSAAACRSGFGTSRGGTSAKPWSRRA